MTEPICAAQWWPLGSALLERYSREQVRQLGWTRIWVPRFGRNTIQWGRWLYWRAG